MKTIDQSQLAEITQRLIDEFQPEQVILFGSHAWGTPHDDSDLDLLVIIPTSSLSEYERMVCASRAIGELLVPADILVKTRAEFEFFRDVPASLEHAISEQGKVLYERSETTTRAELADHSQA
ncbi:MAG: nucleotidyltransferase domain-containing protein [Chloroflexi bacterium]|nr:nucleotidyltransferase domain-containing protein [Chloroflexota bacterium]